MESILLIIVSLANSAQDPLTKVARGTWEARFKDTIVSPLFDALSEKLKHFYSYASLYHQKLYVFLFTILLAHTKMTMEC